MKRIDCFILGLLIMMLVAIFTVWFAKQNMTKPQITASMHNIVCDNQEYIIPIPDNMDLDSYSNQFCQHIAKLEESDN